jgi:23S rRNA pseudouridine2605 synthase
MAERLQKILAKAGIASRRAAEELIRQGKVTVDGQVITELGTRADPTCQTILCEGKPLTLPEEKIYILLNKPAGYVTTASDPQGRPVVTSLVKHLTSLRVFPVGRLDLDTEGALLLTNDGELAQRVQHPSFEVRKSYEALVVGQPSRETIRRLEQGIELEGRRTWPASIRSLASARQESRLEITIHEGRKRQVRKMFAAVGHPVLRLKRIAYGGLMLGALPTGKARILDPHELTRIFD